jgi:hypothetical protein
MPVITAENDNLAITIWPDKAVAINQTDRVNCIIVLDKEKALFLLATLKKHLEEGPDSTLTDPIIGC